jgi:uncharacterized membrane protein YccC
LMVLMILAMVLGYSVWRRNYFIYSVFVTIFVMIAFHFLYNHDFREVALDRVIDTAIGSFIALAAGFVFIPSWSHETMLANMLEMVKANQRYFSLVTGSYTGRDIPVEEFKLGRKEAFVALANLSDNFQRILTEPRSKRRNVPFLYEFVVSSQMFVAHTASLAYYSHALKKKYSAEELDGMVSDVQRHLNDAGFLLGEPREGLGELRKGLGEPPEGLGEPPEAPRPGHMRPIVADAAELPGVLAEATASVQNLTLLDQFQIIRSLSRDIENSVRKFEGGGVQRLPTNIS